jgi:ABC-type Fe3+/spermidine/putrescine transport system ATPase subunit
MADRMAVMRDGRLEQLGDPRAVYCSPANRFVADFLGETNWLPATVTTIAGGELLLATEFGPFRAPSRLELSLGQKVWLGFRPEAVQMGPAQANCLTTTISHVTYLGETEQYVLELSAAVQIKAFEQNPLEVRRLRTSLVVHVAPRNLFVLPRE